MDDPEPRTAGRPRRPATDERIVEAAVDLLHEHGPDAVNVAAVAARTGLARTTIYRRHRDREELLRLALERVTVRGAPPEDLEVEAKVRWLLDRTEEVLDAGIGMGGIASVLTGTDPELAAALRRALDEGLRPVRDQVGADVAGGRLPPAVDPDTLLTVVLGAYLAERLLRGRPTGPGWKDRLVVLLRPVVGTDDG